MSDFEQVVEAKTVSQTALLARRNVIGVGVGYRAARRSLTTELSVVVLVRDKLPRAALSEFDLVPQEVGGVRTDVIEVGDIRPLNRLRGFAFAENGHTTRRRPAPGGVSLGHYLVTAGTFGCVVRDRASGERLILSNNHVLANGNAASAGDPILQPGPADGGEVGRDTLAYLERFVPIRYGSEPATCSVAQAYARFGNLLARIAGASHRLQAYQANPTAVNHIDAAIARPVHQGDILDDIFEIGPVCGTAPPALGMGVIKSGRTTGYTSGTITVLDAAISVNYGFDRSALFNGQVVSSPMSQGGDSGSLALTSNERRAVGLLFAGSSKATIFNPIQLVLDRLRVTLPEAAPKALPRRSAADRAQAVKTAHSAGLLALPNVVGVGLGLMRPDGNRGDEIGLVVLVERIVPEETLAPEDRIPAEIDGVPVEVRLTGKVTAGGRR